MAETVDITPHPALGLAYLALQALMREGFTFTDEDGDSIEGLALVAIAGTLIRAEQDGRVLFGHGLNNVNFEALAE